MTARLARAPADIAVAARSTGSGKNRVTRRPTTKRAVDGHTGSRHSTTDDVMIASSERDSNSGGASEMMT